MRAATDGLPMKALTHSMAAKADTFCWLPPERNSKKTFRPSVVLCCFDLRLDHGLQFGARGK